MKLHQRQPSQGTLLLSEPFLKDPFFKRSVILLIEHGNQGSWGFILNKPVDVEFNELVPDFPEFAGKLHVGGPVSSDQLFYIHTAGNKISDSVPIMEGLYWGGNFETIKALIAQKEITSKQIRFFGGYSGWSTKQLENEMKENSWIVTDSNAKRIMDLESAQLWVNTLKTMGKEFAMMANFPEDPSLN